MPSPPPRKVKPTVWLREIHGKQLGSLQAREQQLLDIIEDIRSYSKQRADIERLYGQSLLKLSTQLLAKKELFHIEENTPNDENKTIHSAWRSCLEETEKLGTSRVKAAEIYSQNVSERCKVLKLHKASAIKRALDQLSSFQADLTQSVKEFGASHKQYTEDEIQAFEARSKANAADQRLNNKDTGLFSSVGTLKKSQAKSIAKMEQCNSQSTTSRNGYLLELSAVNAHTSKLHTKHVPTLFKALDDGVYDQLSSCISLISQTEIDSCTSILSTHSRVVSNCELVTPQYNLDCFLQANPVFSEQVTFRFEPVQDDPVTYLSTDYGEDQRLEKETRNWARKVAKETRSLADLHDRINQITNKAAANQGSSSDSAMEAELQKLQAWIRRSEIAKLKAEARLELLRTANMPVDAILTQATTEHESQSLADTQSVTSRGSSQHSADTYDSFSDSATHDTHHRANHSAQSGYQTANQHQADSLSTSQDSALSTVLVIYNYMASQQDELSLQEGELLSILDHGSGDGWLRACNSAGAVGMVPENYIEPYEDTASAADNSAGEVNSTLMQSPAEPAGAQYDIQSAPEGQSAVNTSGLSYVRALYDYPADGEDEISFSAGQVITLLSRDENGIDDGYWKGEVNGVQGMFPSLVVEEIDEPTEDAPSDPQFSTWEESEEITPQPPHAPLQQSPPPRDSTTPQSAPQTFAGSYSQPTTTAPPNQPHTHYRSAPPLPAIPDEEEEEETEPDCTEQTMNVVSELYPPHSSPRVRRHYDTVCQDNDLPPPVISRTSKPSIASPGSIQPTRDVDSLGSSRRTPPNPPIPPIPQKPTVDYSRKPVINDPEPHPARDDVYERPVGRRAERPSHLGPAPRHIPAPRPQPVAHTDDTEDNIRGRYSEIRANRSPYDSNRSPYDSNRSPYDPNRSPYDPNRSPYDSDPSNRVEDDIESRRFRQMQPVPHQYYMSHAGGWSELPREGRGSDSNLIKDRSSSGRSFASLSSADSQDDKQMPIMIPGRRHLSSGSPLSEPLTPVTPLSVREASRLLPQGLVNPSYRVATMSVDVMPSSGGELPRAGARPSPSRRQGGLPGHVRQGIVQGRKTLSEAANNSPAAANPRAMARLPKSKSETAV